ncbi:hypothetical protein [Mycoplasmopsis caviae]|uniref:Uncharacterized protein n=1 Tax=Mycoplasmopsis caviae TaxID=55603 RepID=A0A3P8MDW3_9BACT|nr:hypothetical protein [Mycoplasmopsis caviae]VDR42310.1 Uncharacterised protein [Mycoplasmopsis caviae]
MNKKVIVWALYDDGNMCYYQSLKDNENLEVYPVGINDIKDIENYKRIDLSLNNLNLLKELKSQLPKPNIILASPPLWELKSCRLLTSNLRWH